MCTVPLSFRHACLWMRLLMFSWNLLLKINSFEFSHEWTLWKHKCMNVSLLEVHVQAILGCRAERVQFSYDCHHFSLIEIKDWVYSTDGRHLERVTMKYDPCHNHTISGLIKLYHITEPYCVIICLSETPFKYIVFLCFQWASNSCNNIIHVLLTPLFIFCSPAE